MLNIFDLSFADLQKYLEVNLQAASYSATQIWHWLYNKLEFDFANMSNIKLSLRTELAKHFTCTLPKIAKVSTSSDGTQKLLLELADHNFIEAVLIPSLDHNGKVRYAECLSTQVGCPMGCSFCATGALGFTRNLKVSEITGQVLVGRKFLHDLKPDQPIIKNLVFMGMGEPLLNYENLICALKILHSQTGLAFSTRRLTVSTCGIKNKILDLGRTNLCYLAISLHAPNQELRAKLMPKAASYHLDALLEELKKYPLKPREFITFEYILLRDVNDSQEMAKALAKIVQQVKGKLNLIAYNQTETSPYKAPTAAQILAFEQVLWQKQVTAILRQSKGQDIQAACGQLAAKFRKT